MEVVAATPNGTGVPPFHNHDVREWSRIDSLTGVLERARLETDHWTASTNNSSHKYGKVVDCRARSAIDGALHQAKRQLEVFQSHIPGGHLQVIKTHTVSSSRWSHKSSTTGAPEVGKESGNHFEDLQLSLNNPLDLSSQKAKASVGRSVGRRPPTRSRVREESSAFRTPSAFRNAQQTAAVNLQRVSRLCHQVHDNAVKQAFGGEYAPRPPIHERENGDGRVDTTYDFEGDFEGTKSRPSLTRAKSTSSDDLSLLTPEKDKSLKSVEDLEDLEQLQNWRRTSKIRRSLQFPKTHQKPASRKPADLPENTGSVRKIREDLETGRRLSTALRGNTVDLEALDQILQSISGSSSSSTNSELENQGKLKKRNSFVTVESLQEVKGRLRRTSSPKDKLEEPDDGIVTEDSGISLKNLDMPATGSRVRSYVYGMEAMLNNKKPVLGTGSLESKSKLQNGSSGNRSEDWYNRRKSYGFEQVGHQQEPSMQPKTRAESSTDSGICRSTEIVKNCDSSESNVKKFSSLFERKKDLESTKITIPIGRLSESTLTTINGDDNEHKRHSIAVDESKYVNRPSDNKFRRTSLVVNDFEDNEDDFNLLGRKPKKVEFCKTEVHFAADSGKVNIVETDEKPPPTNNFRRRRKNFGLTNLDDFNRNGLPVLHFGDSSYEKSLLGLKHRDEDSEDNSSSFGNVTVNSNHYHPEFEDDYQRDVPETDTPRGILKNKPIKPKPYHLGLEDQLIENHIADTSNWGVKLKPVPKDDTPPIWRSTVTVRNTFYDKPQPDHQPELRNDPVKFGRIQIVSPSSDSRRASWSVADRVRQVEDLQENSKGYSTKVNFGNGEATVVENGSGTLSESVRHTTWPRREGSKDERQSILNKGLVVRIGRDNSNSKHTVCSKTTTNSDSNSTTTTTKITIDLSPSPLNNEPIFPFKSTSLILNTIKQDEKSHEEKPKSLPKKTSIPQQLEALRKLYEDVMSDSEADKEVQSLMSRISEKQLKEMDDDNSSVVSGSWSKLKAFKNVSRCVRRSAQSSSSFSSCAQIEKDLYTDSRPTPTTDFTSFSRARIADENFDHRDPIRMRTTPAPLANYRAEVTNPVNIEKLSSPSLVGLSRYRSEPVYSNGNAEVHKTVEMNTKEAPSLEVPTKDASKLRNRSPGRDIVLRQPRKSEMAYFGVSVSPQPSKNEAARRKEMKLSSEKPDLLQHHETKSKKGTINTAVVRAKSPIYMNVQETAEKAEDVHAKREFDASILEELTRAADQILQAVNGYTDDDSHHKHSTDEDKSKNWKNKPLDTISETKSWNRNNVVQTKTSVARTAHSKSKLKHTSSTSSVESVSRECRKPVPVAPARKSSLNVEKLKKKVTETPTSTKAITKARRLQRASSREALLQSHGSSSEDLAANVSVPVRKPRLVKKTKTSQFSVTNGIELNKKSAMTTVNYRNHDEGRKVDERVQSVGVPEIRHKTAVSTIRSTAERAAIRARSNSRLKNDEQKRRSSTTKSKESSRAPTHASTSRAEKSKTPTTSTRENTSHRISTANIKKCSRLEGATAKH